MSDVPAGKILDPDWLKFRVLTLSINRCRRWLEKDFSFLSIFEKLAIFWPKMASKMRNRQKFKNPLQTFC